MKPFSPLFHEQPQTRGCTFQLCLAGSAQEYRPPARTSCCPLGVGHCFYLVCTGESERTKIQRRAYISERDRSLWGGVVLRRTEADKQAVGHAPSSLPAIVPVLPPLVLRLTDSSLTSLSQPQKIQNTITEDALQARRRQ